MGTTVTYLFVKHLRSMGRSLLGIVYKPPLLVKKMLMTTKAHFEGGVKALLKSCSSLAI